jgi:TolB-like protein
MPNKLSQFWQELKRRNVVRVITVYAGAAFVIIELINNITEPLRLPEWTPTLVIVLLAIGFPILIIFSWIYDIHPEEGMVKTEPSDKLKEKEVPKSSNGWRIASYISFVVIVGLIVLNIFGGKRGARIDESFAKTIAVLPFHNYSGDQDQDPICLGLTNEVISHLFKVQSFNEVRSLTSVLPYRDSEQSAIEIAQALNVNYVLEGSLKRINEKIRITAQLIEPRSDQPIWIKDYDFQHSQVIGIPAEIALNIAEQLKAFITQDEQQRIERIPTLNEEAYRLIQKSKSSFYSHILKSSPEEIAWAMQATKLDPNYADAFAWIGYMIFTQGNVYGTKSIQTVAWDALDYFETALGIDPNNATAHYGMARINEFQKYNYISAEKEYLRAIELEPNNSFYTRTYSNFLVRRSLYKQALFYRYRTDSLNGSPSWEHRMWIQGLSGNVSETIKIYESYKSKKENIHAEIIGSGLVYIKEYALSIPYLINNQFPRGKAHLALAYYYTKSFDEAEFIINQLKARSLNTTVGSPEFFIGFYYSGINEIDSAFIWLDKAYENRSPELSWLKTYPQFENIKDDPRYRDLYERTGHKAYDDYMASKERK